MNKPPKSLKDILIGLSLDLSDNLIQIQKLERELTDRRSTQVVLATDYQRTLAQLDAIEQYSQQRNPETLMGPTPSPQDPVCVASSNGKAKSPQGGSS